jgi:hypothetical protein
MKFGGYVHFDEIYKKGLGFSHVTHLVQNILDKYPKKLFNKIKMCVTPFPSSDQKISRAI